MRYVLSIVSLVGIAMLLNACNFSYWLEQQSGMTPPQETAVVDQALIDYGIDVYLQQYCGVCHTLDAASTTGTFGPAHNQMGLVALERVNAANYHGEATTAEGYIRESLLHPEIYYAPGYEATSHHMPPYSHISAEQIDALVYMLVHQLGTDAP